MLNEPGWVLVVLGDAVRRMALFRLLEWAGHRATVADSGQAALALLQTESFDLVLLDASIGEPNGYEVLRKVRSDPEGGRVPLLIVAWEGDVDSVAPWIERGADDILTQPFMPVVVRARINASLARKRLSDRYTEHRAEIERIIDAVVAASHGTFDENNNASINRIDPVGRLDCALRKIAAVNQEKPG